MTPAQQRAMKTILLGIANLLAALAIFGQGDLNGLQLLIGWLNTIVGTYLVLIASRVRR